MSGRENRKYNACEIKENKRKSQVLLYFIQILLILFKVYVRTLLRMSKEYRSKKKNKGNKIKKKSKE